MANKKTPSLIRMRHGANITALYLGMHIYP